MHTSLKRFLVGGGVGAGTWSIVLSGLFLLSQFAHCNPAIG